MSKIPLIKASTGSELVAMTGCHGYNAVQQFYVFSFYYVYTSHCHSVPLLYIINYDHKIPAFLLLLLKQILEYVCIFIIRRWAV